MVSLNPKMNYLVRDSGVQMQEKETLVMYVNNTILITIDDFKLTNYFSIKKASICYTERGSRIQKCAGK